MSVRRRTLPLGASEERLVGTLDLDAALGQGKAQFSPGVLAQADGGVLEQLTAWGATGAEELDGRPENVTFSMPKELRVRSLL